MSLKVLNNYLLIEPDKQEFVDTNPEIVRILNEGIIKIPEKYEGFFKKTPMSGTLVTWGDKCRYLHQVGDKILFGRFAGAKIQSEGKNYLIIQEADILAKIDD